MSEGCCELVPLKVAYPTRPAVERAIDEIRRACVKVIASWAYCTKCKSYHIELRCK